MKTVPAFSFALPLLCLSASAFAGDHQWLQWRGPLGNGVAPTAEPPIKWSETENVRWKTAIPGFGTSTPIVAGDRVFLLTAMPVKSEGAAAATPVPATPAPAAPEGGGRRGGGGRGGNDQPTEKHQFAVVCLDRASGKIRWQKVVREGVPHQAHHRDHGYASASPVTDGQMVYAYFGSYGLYALDLDGNVKWEVDFGDMQTKNSFGEGASPALHGDAIIVNWDHEGEDFIAAIDKKTGKDLWRKQRDEPTNWSTPLIVEHEGVTQAIVNGTGKARSYNVKTGDLLWEAGGQTSNPIPSAVAGHGLAFVMSGFRGAALHAIKLGAKGDVTGSDSIAWSYNKGTPYVPSPLLYGDELYFFGGNNPMISIFDAKTGQRHVEAERLSGLNGVYASPVGAAGRVYVTGRDGGFVVLKQGPKLEVLATNKLDDKFDASPAAVGKELFVRGHKSLYCLAEK
ncbi:MAG TPA: PQQ-binding-like beta-propeller repeat protein [Chthoniobacteraceae bacterium]|jgi:outer membrane protein assembly factor BamB